LNLRLQISLLRKADKEGFTINSVLKGQSKKGKEEKQSSIQRNQKKRIALWNTRHESFKKGEPGTVKS
jgi:hypothetical protein